MLKMAENTSETDVVIVGAGIAGLTAAHNIYKKHPTAQIIVLEANGRVGGRTLTEKLKTAEGKDAFDLGAQWVGSTQTDVMQLIDELNLTTFNQYHTGIKCMILGQNGKVRHYKSDIPSLSLLGLWDLHRCISKIESMSKQIPLEDPSKCIHAAEWDAISFAAFKQQLFWTREAHDTIDAACRCMYGMETSQISLLYFLTYCAAAGGVRTLTEAGEGSAQEMKIKGGAQQISSRLMDRIGTEKVLLNQPVSTIVQDSAGVTIQTKSGDTFHCKRAILAIPPCQINKIDFEPELPDVKKYLINRAPMGNLIKIIITYDKAFWRDAGYSGEIVTNGGKSVVNGCDAGPLCIVYDNTSAIGSPSIVAFIGGDQALHWRNTTDTVRKEAVLAGLESCFGRAALNYVQYIEKDWANEMYVGGCPTTSVCVGAMTYFAKGLRQPFNRIHFAGTESAVRWCGYMSGAVQSGNRAANEVLFHLKPDVLTKEEREHVKDSLLPQKQSNRRVSLVEKVVGHHVFRWTIGIGSVCVLLVIAKKAYFRIAL
ncbi:putative flavin-containing monoamine oxidase A [Tubulanus polymorphus]|uniref:putative flavin-containing monoamine oxidase A n=1 Tax=Tubulanus polymorphus TaxID=672921 RepID=UPI003DA3AE7A